MRRLAWLTTALLALTTVPACAGTAVETVRIDVAKRTLFEGWGTSLCWWANRVGDWPDDRLDELLDLIVSPDDGLGYTIFRYSIGGGDAPGHDHMRPGGAIPGFKPGPNAPYDWTADGNQRRVLLKLRERVPGAIFEAFANSPPYWMTVSGCAAGAADGGDNLRPDAEAAFADYLTEVVRHYRDSHGVVFRTLSPLNEPNARWWRAGHNQEGCHVGVPQQQRLIQAVARALQRKQLTATGVAAPETNSIDDCVTNLRVYDNATFATLAQINTHTYAGTRRKALREIALHHEKRIWQSESGPLDLRGASPFDIHLAMAERIVVDLNEMRVAAWLDWQVIDSGVWSCIDVNERDHTFRKAAKFPCYALFTRAIRPGDQVLHVNAPHVLAALSDKRRCLTIVVVNATAEAKTYRFALESGLRSAVGQARLMRTSETEPLVDLPPVAVDKDGVALTCAPRSVTAIVISLEAAALPARRIGS